MMAGVVEARFAPDLERSPDVEEVESLRKDLR